MVIPSKIRMFSIASYNLLIWSTKCSDKNMNDCHQYHLNYNANMDSENAKNIEGMKYRNSSNLFLTLCLFFDTAMCSTISRMAAVTWRTKENIRSQMTDL